MTMRRRHWLQLTPMLALATAAPARAHHGWSAFDQNRPIYLEGRIAEVRWRNPHAELVLELAQPLALPADLAQRVLPAQTARVDTKELLTRAVLPVRRDARWEIELAPLSRMDAWKVPRPEVGEGAAALGFTFRDERGAALMRAEYLWLRGQAYGLRSSPA